MPISGLTTNSRFQQGTLITPGANDLLTTVSVIDPIWVVVNVSNTYFIESQQDIREGKLIIPKDYDFDVTLRLADGSEYPHPGTVSFVSPVLNPSTGTLSARGIFPNPKALLKPGQFVRARVTGANRPNAIIVSQGAVLQGEAGRFVFVVTGGNRVESREVTTCDWYEEYWIIIGVTQGGPDTIIINNTGGNVSFGGTVAPPPILVTFNVDVTAAGSVDFSGNLDQPGLSTLNVNATAGGNVDFGSTVFANSLTVDATGSVTFGATNANILNSSVTAGGNISLNGMFDGGSLNFSAGGDINISSSPVDMALGALTMTAGNNVNIAAGANIQVDVCLFG